MTVDLCTHGGGADLCEEEALDSGLCKWHDPNAVMDREDEAVEEALRERLADW